MIILFITGACRRESKRYYSNLLFIIYIYRINWEHLNEKSDYTDSWKYILKIKIINWVSNAIEAIIYYLAANIRSSFKKWSSYNLCQLTEHLIEYTHDWELREYWIRLKAR